MAPGRRRGAVRVIPRFSTDWGNVWSLDPKTRGFVIEIAIGPLLPGKGLVANFPVIDRWDPATGTGISIKSLDTSAGSYQKSGQIYKTTTEYVDKLASFGGADKGGDIVENVKNRQLVVVIPPGATESPLGELEMTKQYGKQHGVVVKVYQADK